MKANGTPRLVQELPDGRLLIEISKRMRNANGEVQRMRIRRKLPAGTTRQEAQAIAARMEHAAVVKAAAVAPADGWDAYVSTLAATRGSWIAKTLAHAKHRARGRGMECTLTADQIRHVLHRSRGRCEVTGLRFTTTESDGARTRPFFHSLDRIDSRIGYTVDNVRVVCFAANMAMNQWGEEVFAELARGYIFNRYSAFYAGLGGLESNPHRIAQQDPE